MRKEIPPDNPGTFCPQCLLGLGLAEELAEEDAGEVQTSEGVKGLGDRIGRYRLLQEIGYGGCGAVYMAEQQEPVRRRVALKVIKLDSVVKCVVRFP